MKFRIITGLLSCIFFMGGCTVPTPKTITMESTTVSTEQNPFYTESSLYMKYPEFDKIKNKHYTPAFEKGMADHMAEIDAIAERADSPTLENTIISMEKSGALLDRVATVFFALTSANTNDEMEKIRSEMAPKLSAHSDQILLNGKLFHRVKTIYEQRDQLGLDAESKRLVEKYYTDFIRSGANLSSEEKESLKKINGEMAVLQTTFSQNVLKEVNALAVVVDSKEIGRASCRERV